MSLLNAIKSEPETTAEVIAFMRHIAGRLQTADNMQAVMEVAEDLQENAAALQAALAICGGPEEQSGPSAATGGPTQQR